MNETQIFNIIGGIVVSIIGYFLKNTMDSLKDVSTMAYQNKAKLDILENNHNHLTDKFEMLYEAVKDLTNEIKNLSNQLAKKKDI